MTTTTNVHDRQAPDGEGGEDFTTSDGLRARMRGDRPVGG